MKQYALGINGKAPECMEGCIGGCRMCDPVAKPVIDQSVDTESLESILKLFKESKALRSHGAKLHESEKLNKFHS